jgi:hypothetical protein
LAGVFYWLLVGAFSGLIGWFRYSAHSALEPAIAQKKANRLMTFYIIIIVSAGGVAGSFLWTHFSARERRLPVYLEICNELRRIDSAKNQFALEKKLGIGAVVAETDIVPYLTSPLLKYENLRYVLTPIGENPYAIFDGDCRIPRDGDREGHTIPKGQIYTIDYVPEGMSAYTPPK